MQEKYGSRGKKLYFAFIDLEKHLIEYLERSLNGLRGMFGECSHGNV